ncbi:MAG TPA: coproporphyrinogen-III oxidase family protein [Phycisphaerae bacterium]|nr:coproporphyrinogen-III oxidase family protein [Phycisphaerae bacterium]
MSDGEMLELPQIKTPEPTEVGSYFVANYPPFSVWQPEHIPSALAALDAASHGEAVGRPVGLYLHIPFCRKRCKFCYFRVYTDKNADEVDVYTDALGKEIGLYAERQALAGRQFEFVYFGGGTPSFLSNEQLLRLIDRIRQHWNWDAAREVTFECEPGTLKESKLATIKEIGVTRLSLGIEHFDDEVLSINGRAHKSPEVFRSYEWARAVCFDQINIDLIAGMVGDTEDKWRATVEKALILSPDSLTIYQMELPFNAVFSREAVEAGTAPPVAGWATKRAWVNYAFDQFLAAGYVVSSAYTLIKPSTHAGFVYRDSLWHGADMIGTGVASFSHFGGVHYQNADQWHDYIATVERSELPIGRALAVPPRSLAIREMILQLKTGRIDAGYFRDKFDLDILEEFGGEWAAIEREGYATHAGDEIRLTREGLLRADALLPRFFERPYRNIRYT